MRLAELDGTALYTGKPKNETAAIPVCRAAASFAHQKQQC